MNAAPKWFVPVAILAVLWNLLGCVAFAGDLMLTADDVARLPPDLAQAVRDRFPALRQDQHFGTEAGREALEGLGPGKVFQRPSR